MKEITLKPGESVVIKASKPTKPVKPPTKPQEATDVLLTIGSVKIYVNDDGSYCKFTSDLDICNDGSGPDYDDPHHQAMTAYYSGGIEGGKYLNADVDRYIVVPPQVRAQLPGVVMGCRGRVTNTKTKVVEEGVVGEIGPSDKTGETAYCLAKKLNPAIGHNSGDSNKIYLYELWPDVPATDGDFTYKLQPA
jgi:hypothetical protein